MTSKIINTLHGRIAVYHENDHISKSLLRHGQYEWYVVSIISFILDRHRYDPTGVFVDIGTNIGLMSIPIAKHYSTYKVHSFEIQPHIIDILNENIKLNDVSNITLHTHALGNAESSMELKLPNYETANNIGAFSLNSEVWDKFDDSVGRGDMVTIDIKPLDSVDIQGNIRCIKIDVEGFEQQVLEGAVETLKKHNYPPIVYELWSYYPWWKENSDKLKHFLEDLGYVIGRYDDTGIAVHSSTRHLFDELLEVKW